MNRFHVHLNVIDLTESVRFYSTLFGAEPAVLKSDYAKWMLDDPRVNFAISNLGNGPGVDHLGIQAENEQELAALGERLVIAGGAIKPEQGATCCYAKSDKAWTEDPQGTRWETFHTFGEATTYYASDAGRANNSEACAAAVDSMVSPESTGSSCCATSSACC